METATWTCPVGWPVQGIAAVVDSSRIGDVCRSHQGDVLAVSDDRQCINLVRYPALGGVGANQSWGHTATATGGAKLAFLHDDRSLVSVGGPCVFMWRYV
ncbi:unnamed protein product, partial [Discosporangium mesarthrocarpum]